MSTEQRRYKEMFDEISLSEDRKVKIEEAMRMETRTKRKFSVAKFAVLTTCMIAMLSCVCVAAPMVVKTVEDMLKEKGDVITYESRGEGIPNKITLDTKEITMLVNGEPFVWEIDVTQALDENGNVDLKKLSENIGNDYIQYHFDSGKESGKISSGFRGNHEIDDEGNLYIEIWTDDSPLNPEAWWFTTYGSSWCLVVPKNVTFVEDIEFYEFSYGERGIPLPRNMKEDEVIFYDFIYNGEEYTVAVFVDDIRGRYTREIIKKEEK